MMRHFCLLTTCAFSLGLSSAFAQEVPKPTEVTAAAKAQAPARISDPAAIQARIDTALKEYYPKANALAQELAQAGQDYRSVYKTVSQEMLGNLDFSALSVHQFVQIHSHLEHLGQNVLETAFAKCVKIADKKTPESAQAQLLCYLLFADKTPAMQDKSALLAMFLKNPHATTAFADSAIYSKLVSKLYQLMREFELQEIQPLVTDTIAVSRGAIQADSLPLSQVPFVKKLYFTCLENAANELLSPAALDGFRDDIVAYLERGAQQADTGEIDLDSNELSTLYSTLATMTGPIARGKLIGSPSPEIGFAWSSDESIAKLSDLKGKIVLVDFWSTGCGPCIQAFPHMREMVTRYKDLPVAILGVTGIHSYRNEKVNADVEEGTWEKVGEQLTKFMQDERFNVTWPIVVAENGLFNPDFGVQGIPHIAIIDAKGVVRYNKLNPHRDAKAISTYIDELLEKAGHTAPTQAE